MTRREIADTRFAITGTSSGIGRALAVALAGQKARLVLNARRQDKLDELAAEVRALGAQAEIVAGDITEPAVRAAIIQRAETSLGGLDVLVNNTGIGAVGRFDEAGPERLRRIMEVNFFALVEMTRLALPLLNEGRHPMIVNVSSILGHRALPRSSEYCASKFAVQGFSEALRAELHASGVDVLVVSPGTTATEFFDSVIDRRGSTRWRKQPGVPAEVVARRMVRAIRRGSHEIVPNARGQMLVWLNRLAPRLTDAILQRYG
jgi:short-subunit dehydrogenase